MGVLALIVLAVLITQVYSSILYHKYTVYKGFRLETVGDITVEMRHGDRKRCIAMCLSGKYNCKSISWRETKRKCKLHSSSPFDFNFTSKLFVKDFWDLVVLQNDNIWQPIAKFSTNKAGTFAGSKADDLWQVFKDSPNGDPCLMTGVHQSCTKHFVHRNKDWILGLKDVTKMKVNLYENSAEAAWAIFEKKPGADDNWFQPSRVIDSYPWDTELLKSSAEIIVNTIDVMFTSFSILRSDPFTPFGRTSAHQHWMKIHETGWGVSYECSQGHMTSPQILYSKSPNPTLLSKSNISLVTNYTMNGGTLKDKNFDWATAESFCQLTFGIDIATIGEVDAYRVEGPYQCCNYGWMANRTAGYPMNEVREDCGNGTGVLNQRTDGVWDVYCKPDQSFVGLADTMVISFRLK